MDHGSCIHTEQECNPKTGDNSFSEITFRPYDESIDKVGFICLVNDFLKLVHLYDHNELIELRSTLVNHVEAKICEWAYRGCFVHLAMHNNKYIGFMVYESEKDVFAYLKAVFLEEKYRKSSLLYKFEGILVQKGIKKLLALSYKHNVEFKESDRKKLIAEKDGLLFWDIDLKNRGF